MESRPSAELRLVEDALQEWHLPLADAVRPPLVEDLADLGIVDDAADIAAPLAQHLDERGEDGA